MKQINRALLLIFSFSFCFLVSCSNIFLIGPAISDWIYDKLPNGYEIWRINSRSITLEKRCEDGTLQEQIIEPYIAQIAYIPNYIFAQQAIIPDDLRKAIDLTSTVFYIVSTSDDILLGPYSESEFLSQYNELGLTEKLIWHKSTALPSDGLYPAEELMIQGEPGDIILVGDMIFEIIPSEEVQGVISAPSTRNSSSRWSVDLSGTEISKSIEITSSCSHAKVWINNEGSQSIKFTITKGSETGTVVDGSSVTIAAGTSTNVYSTNKWPADTYYANFTSGKAKMAGRAACRLASTILELDL